MDLSLRPVTDEDLPRLSALYAATRRHQFVTLGWPPQQLAALLEQQFQAQRQSFRQTHPGATSHCIVDGTRTVGALRVDRSPSAIHLLDIAILPEEQGRGIGRTVLRTLQSEARRTGKRVCLRVERNNQRAKALYVRLGFTKLEEQGLHELMEWQPGNVDAPAPAVANDAPALSPSTR